jgi:hypothetical protein
MFAVRSEHAHPHCSYIVVASILPVPGIDFIVADFLSDYSVYRVLSQSASD